MHISYWCCKLYSCVKSTFLYNFYYTIVLYGSITTYFLLNFIKPLKFHWVIAIKCIYVVLYEEFQGIFLIFLRFFDGVHKMEKNMELRLMLSRPCFKFTFYIYIIYIIYS